MEAFWGELNLQIPAAGMLMVYAYGLLIMIWPLFLALEWFFPVAERTPSSSWWFNWKIVASNFLLTPLFYALAVTLSTLLSRALGLPLFPYPVFEIAVGWPVLSALVTGGGFFLVSCMLGDLWYYWWHRAQHEVPVLWAFHKLHHSEETMNATTIYRSHFLELAGQATIRGFSVGLIVDLTVPAHSVLAAVAAGLLPPIWDIFIHANVRADRLGSLVPFFSTPHYHWIHHSRLQEHQDKNYAIWLPVFDVIFGSYYRPLAGEYPPTGLASGEQIETLWQAEVGPFFDLRAGVDPRNE